MSQQSEIKKQIEYYLSDKNLSTDNFFYDKIKSDKEGWLDLSHIMNCNKIKQMKIKIDDIVMAVKGSTEVELNDDNKKVRRIGNKALPSKEEKKRDAKAKDKEQVKTVKAENAESDVELDEKGNIVLVNSDFENPIIVHFKVATKDKDFKVSWKDVETEVKKHCNKLKIVYSRADSLDGDLAISSHKTNEA